MHFNCCEQQVATVATLLQLVATVAKRTILFTYHHPHTFHAFYKYCFRCDMLVVACTVFQIWAADCLTLAPPFGKLDSLQHHTTLLVCCIRRCCLNCCKQRIWRHHCPCRSSSFLPYPNRGQHDHLRILGKLQIRRCSRVPSFVLKHKNF